MIYVKQINGQATAKTEYTQRELKLDDELYLNETISTQNSITISIDGNEDLTISHGNSLFLDSSVISTNIADEASISFEQLHSLDFISNSSFELTQNEFVDFSNINTDTSVANVEPILNIDDLIKNQNSEIEIYSDETEQVNVDKIELAKQDSQIVENTNTTSGEISSLLLEDDISILYNHG